MEVGEVKHTILHVNKIMYFVTYLRTSVCPCFAASFIAV